MKWQERGGVSGQSRIGEIPSRRSGLVSRGESSTTSCEAHARTAKILTARVEKHEKTGIWAVSNNEDTVRTLASFQYLSGAGRTMRSLVSRRLPSWIKFPAVFLAPFVVAVGSWHLVPGQVEIRHWHALVSGSFTCAGLFALFLLFETSLGRVAKFVLAAVIAVAFLYLAFLAAHIP